MDEESIQRLVERARHLQPEEIVQVGLLPVAIELFWPDLVTRQVAITGERLLHLYDHHPETEPYLAIVLQTMLDPDEIHRNQTDDEMAIFWKEMPFDSTHLMRAAIWITNRQGLFCSVMSARRTRRKDFEREMRRGRLVWKRKA